MAIIWEIIKFILLCIPSFYLIKYGRQFAFESDYRYIFDDKPDIGETIGGTLKMFGIQMILNNVMWLFFPELLGVSILRIIVAVILIIMSVICYAFEKFAIFIFGGMGLSFILLFALVFVMGNDSPFLDTRSTIAFIALFVGGGFLLPKIKGKERIATFLTSFIGPFLILYAIYAIISNIPVIGDFLMVVDFFGSDIESNDFTGISSVIRIILVIAVVLLTIKSLIERNFFSLPSKMNHILYLDDSVDIADNSDIIKSQLDNSQKESSD